MNEEEKSKERNRKNISREPRSPEGMLRECRLLTEKQVGKLLALTEEGDSGREECDGKAKVD